MNMKKFVRAVIFLMVLSSLSLQAQESFLDIKLRVFEGIRE